MSSHYRLCLETSDNQHSQIPPKTEGKTNDWNRGPHSGSREVLLSEGAGRNRVLCSQEKLSGTLSHETGCESEVRRGQYPNRTSGDQRDPRVASLIRAYEVLEPRDVTLEDINFEPMHKFGYQVHLAIFFASVVSVGIWYGIIYAAHAIYMAVR
jgi:hypothetical protein